MYAPALVLLIKLALLLIKLLLLCGLGTGEGVGDGILGDRSLLVIGVERVLTGFLEGEGGFSRGFLVKGWRLAEGVGFVGDLEVEVGVGLGL